MEPDEIWKSLKLGSELDIAGRFVYNGLKVFDEMENFALEEDAFEFLYNISVGIERLLKIWIILSEHDQFKNQEEFEESLITHDHRLLMKRAIQDKSVNLGKPHWKLVSLLSEFYKSHRYDRYSLTSITINDKEKDGLISFIESGLNINIDVKTPFEITKNDHRIKNFIGKIIGKICEICYSGILNEAHRLGVYTYEIPSDGKSFKIFTSKTYDFENEHVLSRELIVYLLGDKSNHGKNLELLSKIAPLDFDPAMEPEYIQALESDLKKLQHTGTLEELYIEDVETPSERLAQLEALAGELLFYDEEE